MFKLPFRHTSRLCRGRYFPSLSFSFHQSARSVYRSSNVCVFECNSTCFMYQFSSEQCDQSSEHRCRWKGNVVFNNAQVYPQSRDLNQIWFIITTLYSDNNKFMCLKIFIKTKWARIIEKVVTVSFNL